MPINKLLISDESIKFLGFDLLKQNITFCLYSGGVVIRPEWTEKDDSLYYKSTLDSDRGIRDQLLINILKSRGFTNEENFICSGLDHYVEVYPHAARV